MDKVFFIKRKNQKQIYKLDLSYFNTIVDYKYSLNLLSGNSHKNFIDTCITQCTAYDILYYYFSMLTDLEYDGFDKYQSITNSIGSIGVLLIIEDLSKTIEKAILSEHKPINLNSFKL